MSNPVKIEEYKDVILKYNKDNGRIVFNFEGQEVEVKYVFEAHQIIDEPRFEDCNLEGYFVDGTFNDHIGLARATKKDIKSGNPYWEYKGRYDMEYKKPRFGEGEKVYPKNEHNNSIYAEFKKQRDIVQHEEARLKNIIGRLANNSEDKL